MIYQIVRLLLKLFIPLITRLEVHGIENIPQSRSLIAVVNHIAVVLQSYVDKVLFIGSVILCLLFVFFQTYGNTG